MTNTRPSKRRSIENYTDIEPPSQSFFALLGLLFLQPRDFFRLLDKISMKHSLWAMLLILALLGFSAIRQATPASVEILPMDADLAFDTEFSSQALSDPSQNWMTALSAAGTQAICWLVLATVLSEVSLFNGKIPQFGRNFRIAVWASTPFALMAAVQILFLTGGGRIGEAGFTGFLNEWDAYTRLNSYIQTALYALASQISLFSAWNLFLIYLGARENLKGKRLTIGLALGMWLSILVIGISLQDYQRFKPAILDDANYVEYPLETETLPLQTMPAESNGGDF